MKSEDFRMLVEGQIMNILQSHGGERLVGGQNLENLLRELTDEFLRMYADEYTTIKNDHGEPIIRNPHGDAGNHDS